MQRRQSGGGLGRLGSSRRGTFIVAAVATLIAALILIVALQKYRHSIEKSNKTATVLVANRFIEQGTAGAAVGVGDYFTVNKVATGKKTPGALSNTASLHGEVAAIDIYPGQQLTTSDFTGGGPFLSRLPANQRAISVPVDASHGLIGDVQTGDRVDVYVSFPERGTLPSAVRLIARSVVVLDAAPTHSSGIIAGNNVQEIEDVGLEVTNHVAGELAYASDYGKVWLILSPARSSAAHSEVITESRILDENPAPGEGGK